MLQDWSAHSEAEGRQPAQSGRLAYGWSAGAKRWATTQRRTTR